MKLGKKLVSMLMAVTTVATMVAGAGAVGSYSGVSMTNGVARRTTCAEVSGSDIYGVSPVVDGGNAAGEVPGGGKEFYVACGWQGVGDWN